jgi:hypothetical protein
MNEKRKVGYILDPDLIDELRSLAASDRRSMSAEIEWLVATEVARRRTIPDMKRGSKDALVRALSS